MIPQGTQVPAIRSDSGRGDCSVDCSDDGYCHAVTVSVRADSPGLDLIRQYPFSQVREKIEMEKSIPSDLIEASIEEFRKYLILIALGHRGLGMISRNVDEVWHTFILFTQDYSLFCAEAFGFYLHHQPGVPSMPLGTEPRKLFLEAYRSEFGGLPEIWGADANQCWGTCSTPSTNCQDPSCK